MINWFRTSFTEVKDYTPSQEVKTNLTTFLSHKIGMFISYGITSFMASDSYATNMLNDPPATSTFAAPSTVDSAQWATEAANLGCDYAVLTTGHHVGFNIFPFTAEYNGGSSENTEDSNRGALSVPVYASYDVSQTSSDRNIIGKFKDQCTTEGIKFGLYYNVGKNINIRRGLDLIDASYDQTSTFSTTYQNYIDFVVKEVEYICDTFKPDYLWLDAPHHAPKYVGNVRTNRKHFQDIFNAVKKYSPDTLVLINYDCAVISGDRVLLPNGTDNTRPPFTWSGDELMIYPADILSFEHTRIPATSVEFNPNNIDNGINYYMPKEIISTIFSNGQYFARNDTFGTLKTSGVLQTEYDKAKTEGIPYLLNVAPAKSGIIPANQITRFGEITL